MSFKDSCCWNMGNLKHSNQELFIEEPTTSTSYSTIVKVFFKPSESFSADNRSVP